MHAETVYGIAIVPYRTAYISKRDICVYRDIWKFVFALIFGRIQDYTSIVYSSSIIFKQNIWYYRRNYVTWFIVFLAHTSAN